VRPRHAQPRRRRWQAPLPALLALLTGGLASAPANACTAIDVGVGWIDDAFRYGRYAAMPAGGFGVLQLHACRQVEADNARHWSIALQDAGLRSRRASASVGVQGRWRFDLFHQQLTTPPDTARTPFRPTAGRAQSLPSGWQPAPTTAGMAALLPSLGPVDLGTRRAREGIGAGVVLPLGWQIEGSARQDRRHGIGAFAGVIGSTGGNARAALLAVPIDQRTRRYDVALIHAGRVQQWRLGYHASAYDNGIDAWRWQNPFAGVAGWHPAASYPVGLGQAQPPPGNRYHQLSIATARTVSRTLRLNADMAIGSMRQDQAFLPYTVNPALQATIGAPLPRPSLQGRIDTTLVNLRLASRPATGWHWQTALRFDERDNRTPIDAFVGIGGDSQAQDASEASGRRRFNLPFSDRRTRASADTGTRISRGLRFDAGFAHEIVDREFAARERTEESSLTAAFRGDFGASVVGGLRFNAAERDGSTYIGSRPFMAGHAPSHVATVPGAFENLPELRQFHLADRSRRQVALFANWLPAPAWTLGLSFGAARDEYRRSELGLTESRLRDMLLDAGWNSDGGWRLHGFVGREWLDARQDGRSFSGGALRLVQAQDPARNWRAAHYDVVDSVGGGMGFEQPGARTSWRADYVLSDVHGEVDVSTGPALVSAPLPDSRARLSRVDLGLDWRATEAGTLRFTLRAEHFRSRDWAVDGVGPATLANVILLGEESPDYRALAVVLAWRHAF
jgi:MtrB/PioB family decaheme-associated outer membrane protein